MTHRPDFESSEFGTKFDEGRWTKAGKTSLSLFSDARGVTISESEGLPSGSILRIFFEMSDTHTSLLNFSEYRLNGIYSEKLYQLPLSGESGEDR